MDKFEQRIRLYVLIIKIFSYLFIKNFLNKKNKVLAFSNVTRNIYQFISAIDSEGKLIFMNYGFYFDKEITLEKNDEINRYAIQLYHKVASAVELSGKDVLEIGSGRGGGASYIKRYLNPQTLTAVDISENAISFCKKHYADISGLKFQHGDAESLPFANSSFDVIINVESSHCYPNIHKFLREVHRVLRPGGCFLIADFRNSDESEDFVDDLKNSGLNLVKEENITSDIFKALDLDDKRKLILFEELFLNMPGLANKIMLKLSMMMFASKGTKFYNRFKDGEASYLFLFFKKP
jgi:ubiquinone/menaquinone biosynthesis C-methylase UbiE